MSETVELEIGELYADLHAQFSEEIGVQYEERARQNFEEFLHNFNQQLERQREKMQEEEERSELNLDKSEGKE